MPAVSASIDSRIFAPFFRCSSAFNKFIEQVIAKMDGENCVRFHCRYLCTDECTKEVMGDGDDIDGGGGGDDDDDVDAE